MMSSRRSSLNPEDADDSDSSDSSLSPVRIPRRSATVSPSTRNSLKRRPTRRKSDFNLHVDNEYEPERTRKRSMRASQERSSSRSSRLRKTNSEPNVEGAGQINLEALRLLLNQLPKLTNGHRPESVDSGEEEEIVHTEIEELRDAAKSIQSLQRVLKLPSQHSSDKGVFSDDCSTAAESSLDGRKMSGIGMRLEGHPRGVMQFIPSIRSDAFISSPEYSYRSHSALSRKNSMPDGFLTFTPTGEEINIRPRRRGVVDDIYASNSQLLERKGSEAIAGVSRFSKLLKSFRSRQSSPEQHPTISWSPFVYSESAGEERTMNSSLMEADALLWKKRSRASLRKHMSVRNLAARELYDTEKSFVEGLEFLVTKYMRPLRQPLECTLIEAGLVDKIFYKIPEILAHHQFLLAALSTRIENWHKDSVIGDVLLAHFSKQSMIETYISFMDNFKFAKQAITQARLKPAFEKYYNRCCRDHRNKLDLDSLLISPIQRVPRYELLVKQLLKHTHSEHQDLEFLLRAQNHIHNLAVGINQHKDETEQQEQRLREIEAIVDGLDDLVSTGRNLLRYDIVSMRNKEKQRCVFTLSDQLVITTVRRKNCQKTGKTIIQSHDFLDSNRFKLLIKISLEDVEIAKDTLAMLQETEAAIETAKENEKVLRKIIELSKLLKSNRENLDTVLDEMDSENSLRLRSLNEKMNSDPDLTTVLLDVTTANGVETVPVEFGSAEKRAAWENTFKEAKTQLENERLAVGSAHLKTVLAHQTRPGLQLCSATVVPGKRADSSPSVWVCACDNYSGQVAVVSLENGESSIESCAGIGNSAITATCTVPPPIVKKKRGLRSQKSCDLLKENESVLDLDSCGSSSDSSSDESNSSGQTTVWIGNADGEIFILNASDRVRSRPREKVVMLANPVTSICYCNNSIYVTTEKSDSSPILLAFKPLTDRTWDIDTPITIPHSMFASVKMMTSLGRRLVIASSQMIYTYDTDIGKWMTSPPLVTAPDFISEMCSAGPTILAVGRRSTTVNMVNVFTLQPIGHFSISSVVRAQLAGREDILREHKMGCLRVSSLTSIASKIWIGTSAGFVISTHMQFIKTGQNPTLTICDMGHSGPCRVLLPVPFIQTLSPKQKRMSLSEPTQQTQQLLIVSCGEGLDEKGCNTDPSTDPINHIIIWKCNQ